MWRVMMMRCLLSQWVSLGLNLWSTEKGARFALEGGTPIYQNLDGPQLGVDWFVTAGIQFAW